MTTLHHEATVRLGRALTPGEEHIDIARLDAVLEEGKKALSAAIDAEKSRAIRDYIRTGDPTMRVTLRMDAVLADLYAAGARLALDELRSMGIRPREPPDDRMAASFAHGGESRRRRRMIRRDGRSVAFRLGETLGQLIRGIGLRIRGEGDDEIHAHPTDPASVIAEAMERRVPGSLDAASRLVSAGVYAGLGAIYEEHEDLFPGWVYTAIMDADTCDVCAHYDGTRYDTWAEAMVLLPDGGPNPFCRGDGRCRCRLVPEMPDWVGTVPDAYGLKLDYDPERLAELDSPPRIRAKMADVPEDVKTALVPVRNEFGEPDVLLMSLDRERGVAFSPAGYGWVVIRDDDDVLYVEPQYLVARVPHSEPRDVYGALRSELDVIAGEELGDVLDSWGSWTADQLDRLQRYLRQEMGGGGMLSVEKARDAGQALGEERRQARAILKLKPGRR